MTETLRFSRPTFLTVAGWVAAAGCLLSAVLSVVWFGEVSLLQWGLVVLWTALAVLYSRPYAVISTDKITLWVSPLRPKSILWQDVASVERLKPGFIRLHLPGDKTVGVLTASVRKDSRASFEAELERYLPALSDTQSSTTTAV